VDYEPANWVTDHGIPEPQGVLSERPDNLHILLRQFLGNLGDIGNQGTDVSDADGDGRIFELHQLDVCPIFGDRGDL
jgi:hypothetical protein